MRWSPVRNEPIGPWVLRHSGSMGPHKYPRPKAPAESRYHSPGEHTQRSFLVKMKLISLFLFFASVAAYGQSSNTGNRRIQYSLGNALEHRRLLHATIARINMIPSYTVRRRAIDKLRSIVRQLQAEYKAKPVEKRQSHRRNRYERFHSQWKKT